MILDILAAELADLRRHYGGDVEVSPHGGGTAFGIERLRYGSGRVLLVMDGNVHRECAKDAEEAERELKEIDKALEDSEKELVQARAAIANHEATIGRMQDEVETMKAAIREAIQ